jgi:hypothetical protein
MWYANSRKIIDVLEQPFDMINSPFAFPRLPPRINPSMGITSAVKIKDQIIHDSDMMIGRLSDYHTMFQRYASSLFNMTPNGFMPGHPVHIRMQSANALREENEKLRQENLSLKSDLSKEKKK